MGVGGIILLVVLAAAFGAAAQFVPGYPGPRTKVDGVIIGIVVLGAEFLGNILKPYGPQWQGVYVGTVVIIGAIWTVLLTLALRRLGRKEPQEPAD